MMKDPDAHKKCVKHNNKYIYKDPNTVISLVLKIQEEQGLKLSWYRCDLHNAYHLCKFANKRT